MSNTVTPFLAVCLIVIIILIAVFIAFRIDPKNYDTSRTHVFIATLAGLGIFVIFLFYYSVIELQQEQIKLFSVQETSRISNSILDIIFDEIQKSSTMLPTFSTSLLPLLQCNSEPQPDQETTEACIMKYNLSYKIFTTFQDVVLSENFVSIEPLAYTTNFLQRANSKKLYEQWIVNKIDFNSKTQKFVDLLFEYALPISEQTSDKYLETAQKLLNDQRYKDLIF